MSSPILELLLALPGRIRNGSQWQHPQCSRPAAVLLLIYPGRDGLELVLTLRTDHLPTHAGQVSLPGGSRDNKDKSPVDTALREASEEIGLEMGSVEVLGALEAVHLPSGFCVTPVIAMCDTQPVLRPCPHEVEALIPVPLEQLLDSRTYLSGERDDRGMRRKFWYFDFRNHYVWGATASILRSFALLLEHMAH